MKMIDLYSGIGGATLGFKQAGFETVFGCETDEQALSVFSKNLSMDAGHDVETVESRSMPHPDVVFMAPPAQAVSAVARLIKEIQPRCMVFEFPVSMIDEAKMAKRKEFDFLGYRCWSDILDAADFGVPQHRKCCYIIGFRKDVKAPFIYFPFPDPTRPGTTLAGVLEPSPAPKLLLTEKQIEGVRKRNDKNAALGTGFRTKILSPADCSPTLPIQYYNSHQRGVLVDAGQGPRRLSVLECKRLMGFPDDWAMDISDKCAYRLLAQASCPPMVAAVAGEIRDWISN